LVGKYFSYSKLFLLRSKFMWTHVNSSYLNIYLFTII
jgi:hypothetical protein